MSEPIEISSDAGRRHLVERRQANIRSLCYALFMSRRRGDRRNEATISYYNDYYEPALLFVALALMILCVADAYLTLLLLQHGSVELNPFMAWALGRHVMLFFLLKYSITAICVVLTVMHRQFRVFGLRGIHVLLICLAAYVFLIQYELAMLLPILF